MNVAEFFLKTGVGEGATHYTKNTLRRGYTRKTNKDEQDGEEVKNWKFRSNVLFDYLFSVISNGVVFRGTKKQIIPPKIRQCTCTFVN